jgi:prepilin-type N-terminal cleavage/methylation domain-containing protein
MMGTPHSRIPPFPYSKRVSDMRKSSIINHPSSIPRGFTIVECLIGLAISAILLAAVAVAFNASVTNYRENEDMFWSVNNARQALARMTSEIRICYPVLADTEPNNQCSITTAPNSDDITEYITYEFRAADHKLYLKKNDINQEYVLCDDVVAARFDKVYTINGDDVRGVQISLTVQSGGSRRTLSSVAAVRRCPYLISPVS